MTCNKDEYKQTFSECVLAIVFAPNPLIYCLALSCGHNKVTVSQGHGPQVPDPDPPSGSLGWEEGRLRRLQKLHV